MTYPASYCENSCTSWNPTGNRWPHEEDEFWQNQAERETCIQSGNHNAVSRNGYKLYECTHCGQH
jgi:ribosomal protein L37AE/L43A